MAAPPRKSKIPDSARAITADLVAVLVAVTDGEPKIMTIAHAGALPSGPFEFKHRSLQSGLRTWVELAESYWRQFVWSPYHALSAEPSLLGGS